MRLYFTVTTNGRVPMINTAIFVDSNSEEVVIDRNTTEYTATEIGDGLYRLEMVWKECYVWDGENENFIADDDASVENLKFKELEIEDDADEEYFVKVEECEWGIPESITPCLKAGA